VLCFKFFEPQIRNQKRDSPKGARACLVLLSWRHSRAHAEAAAADEPEHRTPATLSAPKLLPELCCRLLANERDWSSASAIFFQHSTSTEIFTQLTGPEHSLEVLGANSHHISPPNTFYLFLPLPSLTKRPPPSKSIIFWLRRVLFVHPLSLRLESQLPNAVSCPLREHCAALCRA
jgi:hypothetical protein